MLGVVSVRGLLIQILLIIRSILRGNSSVHSLNDALSTSYNEAIFLKEFFGHTVIVTHSPCITYFTAIGSVHVLFGSNN